MRIKIINLLAFVLYIVSLKAQPSGGPYGPVQQLYELPKANTVYFVAPDGKEDNSGFDLTTPTTFENAISKVVTGDAIILRGGIYRTGNLIFNQGISIQPYKNEKVILKGTKVASNWKNLRNELWITEWDNFFPSKPQSWWQLTREGMYTPLYKFNNDMVFVNGKFLSAVCWPGEVDMNSYYIDYVNRQVYIGVDPADKMVEITAYNVALNRVIGECNSKESDKIGPTIKGITFTQYAYRAIEIEGYDPEGISVETQHGNDVTGTTFENCEISYCSRVAGYFRGNKLTIRNCKISDTSTEGLFILSSNDVLLERNIFTRNNIENITGYFPAAVKIFNQCYRVTCNDNLVIDHPNSHGIWYDVGNVNGVFTNNFVQGVGLNNDEVKSYELWPAQNGFFFEISKGAICAGNVFVDCDHGVMSLNSCDVEFYNNTFYNSMACIARDERSAVGDHFGWHPATGPEVEQRDGFVFNNNLMYSSSDYPRSFVLVHQPANMCDQLPETPIKEMDNNVYVNASSELNPSIMALSPGKNENCQIIFNSLEEINKIYPKFSKGSVFIPNYYGSVFKSPDMGNYRLISEFTEGNKKTILPDEVSKTIKRSVKAGIGAYSLIK